MAEIPAVEKTQYQGQMHLLQKEMMGRYFERVTRAAEQGEQALVVDVEAEGFCGGV